MGYVEETGVAQHFRDARIAPIYEGTNGIQAMDLVGRKLPMRGGGVVKDFLADVGSTVEKVRAAGDRYAVIADALADALAGLNESTDWIMANGLDDVKQRPRRRHAVPAPVRHRHRRLAAGRVGAGGQGPARRGHRRVHTEFLEAKFTTARFYATQLLPQARGLVGAVTAGFDDLMELTPAQF